MLEELDRLQILIAAVFVGYPLAVLLTVIQIEHRCHGVYAYSVDMIFFDPEKGIGNQEVPDFVLPIIENLRSPVRMFPDPRVRMLEQALSVESAQSVGIGGKMRRHPIKNHANLILVQHVDQIHEIIRRAVSRSRRIIAGHLIAPGTVIRILRNSHQLDMRILHLF